MYCPKCGIQTQDSATFCRGCGSNLALVPQALTGNLPSTGEARGRKRKKPRTIGEGISTIFSGLGFVVVAFATLYFAPAGRIWWYWMLIPAFTLMGSGLAIIAEIKLGQPQLGAPQPPVTPPQSTGQPATGEPYRIAPPPSIIEATTRHLDHSRDKSE
jgi:hypothetical protein